MRKASFIALLAFILSVSTLANAALQDNGAGLIYDTDRNITWYDAPAVSRTWSDSMTWAAALTVGGTAAGSWRLSTTPGTVFGYTNQGEMGHIYYNELGKTQAGPLGSTNPFTNLQPGYYWSGTGYTDTLYAWTFYFNKGSQNPGWKDNLNYALAVHEGNVGAPAPIPGAIFLFAPGLIGLALVRRRLKK